MSSTSQQTILSAFNKAAGSQASGAGARRGGGQLTPTNQGLTDALTQATQVINAQTQATSANTDALAQNADQEQQRRQLSRFGCSEHSEPDFGRGPQSDAAGLDVHQPVWRRPSSTTSATSALFTPPVVEPAVHH